VHLYGDGFNEMYAAFVSEPVREGLYGKINVFAPEEENVAPLIIGSSNIDGL